MHDLRFSARNDNRFGASRERRNQPSKERRRCERPGTLGRDEARRVSWANTSECIRHGSGKRDSGVRKGGGRRDRTGKLSVCAFRRLMWQYEETGFHAVLAESPARFNGFDSAPRRDRDLRLRRRGSSELPFFHSQCRRL